MLGPPWNRVAPLTDRTPGSRAARLGRRRVSRTPTASVASMRRALLTGVDKKTALSGKVATGGRLNAYKALKVAP